MQQVSRDVFLAPQGSPYRAPSPRIGLRRATRQSGWLGLRDTKPVLNGDFETFDLFQRKV